jgi:OOP family OmpA-OmpF porin
MASIHLLLATAARAAPVKDVAGAQDPTLFPRPAGYLAASYQEQPFGKLELRVGTPGGYEMAAIEGRVVEIRYVHKNADQKGAKLPTVDELRAHYTAALQRAGGKTMYVNQRGFVFKIDKAGKETWGRYEVDAPEAIALVVIEKGELVQEITASGMLGALTQEGHLALYLHFDTAKATIKPESKPTIDQIVKLLQQNAALSIRVEGHTDTVGDASSNKTLSEARAQAVVKALVDAGIPAARLTAAGFGLERPIAPNDSEAGRARNRRVELVNRDFKPAGGKLAAKDHPLFSRMPNFVIFQAEQKARETMSFLVGKPGASTQVSQTGRAYHYTYRHADFEKPGALIPGPLQVVRNHGNAIKQIGGTVEYESGQAVVMKLVRSGREVWASVTSETGQYTLAVVEK